MDQLNDPMDDAGPVGTALGALRRITNNSEPLKVVFYPDRTKIGFVLKREDLIHHREMRTSVIEDRVEFSNDG